MLQFCQKKLFEHSKSGKLSLNNSPKPDSPDLSSLIWVPNLPKFGLRKDIAFDPYMDKPFPNSNKNHGCDKTNCHIREYRFFD